MKHKQTLYDNWVIDFRKILFCIAVITLGTLYNVKEPNALAIAVIVQGASNIDNFWDCLADEKIYTILRIMSTIFILFSAIAAIFAIYSLGSGMGYFDTVSNPKAWIYIALVVFAVAGSIFPLITDTFLNIQKEKVTSINKMNGEDDDEI